MLKRITKYSNLEINDFPNNKKMITWITNCFSTKQ